MLSRLKIQNIVLITSLEMEFTSGLTVLTGETGAGKSILLDALGLIIGKRAEARLVRAGEESAQVTAEVETQRYPSLVVWLKEQGIDEAEEWLLIRRQIKADGSSRAYVNDQPVTLKFLKELGDRLITIHGQHGQKGLMDSAYHEALLDAYAGTDAIRLQVSQRYRQWKEAERTYQQLVEELQQAERERDYLEHMVKELGQLAPVEGEETELVEKRALLMQAEKSGAVLKEASTLLNGMNPVASILHKAQTLLMRSAVKDSPQGQQVIDALERSLNELAEAETLLGELMRSSPYDEKELEKLEDRLFSLRDMARKHRVNAEELANLYERSKTRLTLLSDSTQAMQEAKKQAQSGKEAYEQQARLLRQARLSAIPMLVDAVHTELKPLKMEATRFQVRCEEKASSDWSASGMDMIAFEVSTNPGSPFGSLSAIASGGELSRLMLAMAVVLDKGEEAAMLIFDEIDTGTGGAVAEAIGSRLAALSRHRQVAVVTHLPQVAAKGDRHYFIQKQSDGERTFTTITRLDETMRREELARMLSGAHITDEARQAALRLLNAHEAA